MATKAAKSITINATKYELANALATNDDKIQLLAKDVVLGEVELPSGADVLFFIRELDEVSGNWIVEVKNGKGETISNKADAYAIIEKGGMVYAVCHSDTRFNLPDSDTYIPMFASVGTASDFYLEFHKRWSQYEEPIMRVLWNDSTPTWQQFTSDAMFYIRKTGMTSLSDLVVGDTVLYSGLDFHQSESFFYDPSITLSVRIDNVVEDIFDNVYIDCHVICAAPHEYGDRTFGVSFIASYNSEKYLIGLKYQNDTDAWTIGSLKAL